MIIKFIQSIDCRTCAQEIERAGKGTAKKIIAHRKKCRKCVGCYRLRKAEERIELKI